MGQLSLFAIDKVIAAALLCLLIGVMLVAGRFVGEKKDPIILSIGQILTFTTVLLSWGIGQYLVFESYLYVKGSENYAQYTIEITLFTLLFYMVVISRHITFLITKIAFQYSGFYKILDETKARSEAQGAALLARKEQIEKHLQESKKIADLIERRLKNMMKRS